MSTEETATDSRPTPEAALHDIATAFTGARRAGAALQDFPGEIPPDLVTAYRVQDMAIAAWADTVVGWKVGYIAEDRRDASGDERLLGPVFARALKHDTGNNQPIETYAGGFGAVEAEYVLQLQADAPADQLDWTPEQAAALPARLYVGLEVASSPLATINQLGPRVVVSDFGNNNGLIVGAEVPDWTRLQDAELTCQTYIDDARVGDGGALRLPGGLRAAYAFALARSARRGRPLKAGDLIATGNATGIHDVLPGQQVHIDFHGSGTIRCHVVAAGPRED